MVYVAKIGFGIFVCCIFSSCKKINTPTITPPSEGSIFNSKQYDLNEYGQIENTEFSLSDFDPAINCQDCHFDHYQEWFKSMHAYSIKDPIFFSGWNKAQKLFPETGERFCIQCHSPAAFLTGEDLTGFSSPEELMDAGFPPAITDGVSCDICHTITSFSETIHTQDDVSAVADSFHLNAGAGIKYGSIENPQANSYHESEYNPIYKRSELCLPCHDMTIRGVDAEITFTEWNDVTGLSMFAALSCQECHMKQKTDGSHDHHFVGVDIDLSYSAGQSPLHDLVQDMLESAVDLQFGYLNYALPDTIISGDSLIIPITVKSKTAHSIPSGTSFSREAWLAVTVTTVTNTIESLWYESGVIGNTEHLDISDSELLLFTTTLLTENNEEAISVTQTHDMINHSLKAFHSRYHNYRIGLGGVVADFIDIDIRMLFRAFKPHLLEENHPDLLANLPIFQMASIRDTVYIKSP